jgi:hypothetical protein
VCRGVAAGDSLTTQRRSRVTAGPTGPVSSRATGGEGEDVDVDAMQMRPPSVAAATPPLASCTCTCTGTCPSAEPGCGPCPPPPMTVLPAASRGSTLAFLLLHEPSSLHVGLVIRLNPQGCVFDLTCRKRPFHHGARGYHGRRLGAGRGCPQS